MTKQLAIDGVIKLGQMLKIVRAISTGGEAKTFLAANAVLINSREAGGRNAKVAPGDKVVIRGVTYEIVSK